MEPVLNQALKAEHVGFVTDTFMSRGMRFPTMWYVRPAKAQTSLA